MNGYALLPDPVRHCTQGDDSPSLRFSPYRIRDFEIAPALVLSPMSGVTCSAFRRLIKSLNPGCVGLLVTEFISVEGMTRGSLRSLEMMRFRQEERPIAVQIFGYDVARVRDGAMLAQDAGADILDINCGCPAPKVVKNGGGCELMRQPEHLARILRAVRAALSIPLTIKIRAGWDSDSRNALSIAKLAESEGVEALAIHARTRTQLYRGEADWELVEQVVKAVNIPVLGSGDVVDACSARERLSRGVAGLYVGRAAIGNPFVFTEIIRGGDYNLHCNELLCMDIIEMYTQFLREDYPLRAIVGRLKQLVSQMAHGYRWAKELCRALSFEQQCEVLARARQESCTSGTSLKDRRLMEYAAS